MARTKASEVKNDVVVLANSEDLDKQDKAFQDKPLTDVVTVYSRLSRAREFVLGRKDILVIPSPNDALKGKRESGIINGVSTLFTVDRSRWQRFLDLFGNIAIVQNGLVGEMSQDEFKDKDTREELKSIKNLYEAADGTKLSSLPPTTAPLI